MVFSLVFLVKIFLSSEGINQEISQKISNDKESNDFSRVIRRVFFWNLKLNFENLSLLHWSCSAAKDRPLSSPFGQRPSNLSSIIFGRPSSANHKGRPLKAICF